MTIEPTPDEVADAEDLIAIEAAEVFKTRAKWCQGCGDGLTGGFGETATQCRWCHMDATDDGSEPEDDDEKAQAEDAHEARRRGE